MRKLDKLLAIVSIGFTFLQAAYAVPRIQVTFQDTLKICHPEGMRLLFSSRVLPNGKNIYHDTINRIASGQSYQIDHVPEGGHYVSTSISSVAESDCPGRQFFMYGTCSYLDNVIGTADPQHIIVTTATEGPLGYTLNCQVSA